MRFATTSFKSEQIIRLRVSIKSCIIKRLYESVQTLEPTESGGGAGGSRRLSARHRQVLINFSSGGSTTTARLAGNTNVAPVPQDYDGDGKADPAVFRRSNTRWVIAHSSLNGQLSNTRIGSQNDVAVPAPYQPYKVPPQRRQRQLPPRRQRPRRLAGQQFPQAHRQAPPSPGLRPSDETITKKKRTRERIAPLSDISHDQLVRPRVFRTG